MTANVAPENGAVDDFLQSMELTGLQDMPVPTGFAIPPANSKDKPTKATKPPKDKVGCSVACVGCPHSHPDSHMPDMHSQ